MVKIVFDFSSSPWGGSFRRIKAYAEYFSSSKQEVCFLVSPELQHLDYISNMVPTIEISKTKLEKLLVSGSYLNSIIPKTDWLFSYGIPIGRRITPNQWLHISNVLPFYTNVPTLKWKLYAKSHYQLLQFRRFAKNVDVLSGESQFSIDRYNKTVSTPNQNVVLRNGFTFQQQSSTATKQLAIAVGTHSYKRLDLTYKVFRFLKKRDKLEKLVIVGNASPVPDFVRDKGDVVFRKDLTDEELVHTYCEASYFISTSEVENSSLAVLEGLTLTGSAVLSDIPSHREMLGDTPPSYVEIEGVRYIEININNIANIPLPTWEGEIQTMLKKMGMST